MPQPPYNPKGGIKAPSIKRNENEVRPFNVLAGFITWHGANQPEFDIILNELGSDVTLTKYADNNYYLTKVGADWSQETVLMKPTVFMEETVLGGCYIISIRGSGDSFIMLTFKCSDGTIAIPDDTSGTKLYKTYLELREFIDADLE